MKRKTLVPNAQDGNLDLSTLELLAEVARRGSFSAVARHRNIDPSAVSRAIVSLESQLGIRLFQRSTRRVVPTDAACAFIESASPALEQIKRAAQTARESAGKLGGMLRVTASVSFGQRRLVPILPLFLERHPEISVELILADTIVDLLAEQIDVAIRLGSLRDSGLVAKRLMQTHYVVSASAAYLKRHGRPAAPRDIADHNCLLFALPGFRDTWKFRSKTGKIVETRVAGNVVTSNAVSLHSLACAGTGIALLPNWLIDAELRQGRLVDLFPQYRVTGTNFETGVWLMYPSRHHVPGKVRAFTRFLHEHFSV